MKNALLLAWARWAPRAFIVLTIAAGCARPSLPSSSFLGDGGAIVSATVNDLPDERVIQIGMDRLHRHVQPDGPVGVVREDLSEKRVWAYTERCGPGYLIHLGTNMHGEFLMSVLVHEWAHCLAFPDDLDDMLRPEDCGGHGAQWGIELSRTFRAVWYDVDTPDYRAMSIPAPQPNTAGTPPADD